jgi:hypothetical protein
MAHLSSHLTNEERSFLQQLFRESAVGASQGSGCGEVELEAIGSAGRRLLDLLSRMDVVIQAEDARQRLHFKLSVVPSPFGGPGRLRVSAPLASEQRRADSEPAGTAERGQQSTTASVAGRTQRPVRPA